MDIDERLDTWAGHMGPRKLKVIRLVSVIVGLTAALVASVAWLVMLIMYMNEAQPSLKWFVIWQFLPLVMIGLPAYYGWYFSDLALIRNYYDQHSGWKWW